MHKVLATALFTESAILLELPLPSWIYNNSTFNSAYVKKKFKKKDAALTVLAAQLFDLLISATAIKRARVRL
ncbi:hypothetical protein PT276_06635 [Orbaceae bacterium ESL0721]|nr:hypothetical protein [Orbaceae bacterium ESL0721]